MMTTGVVCKDKEDGLNKIKPGYIFLSESTTKESDGTTLVPYAKIYKEF